MFTIQTSLGELIDVFGIAPNLILVFVIVYSLDTTGFMATLIGGICGLMTDFADAGIVGIGGFVMMYVSFASSIVSKKFYYDNKLVGIIIVFVKKYKG